MNARNLFAASCVALAAASVHAHVFLDRAEPRVGSQVNAAPAEVKLWFTEPLEGTSSTVTVTDGGGQRIDRADPHVDSANKRLLGVSLKNLVPGAYTVHWRAVSVDGHVTQGDFVFRVAD